MFAVSSLPSSENSIFSQSPPPPLFPQAFGKLVHIVDAREIHSQFPQFVRECRAPLFA